MKRKLLMNDLTEELRIAVLENDELVEYMIERSSDTIAVGNIYKGKVINILPGMDAAFVHIGADENAFIHVNELLPWKGLDKRNKHDIRQIVRQGEELLVQVTKEPIGTKGAKVTTNISLAGAYVVFFPYGRTVGISQRIKDEDERNRLKKLSQSVLTNGEGLVFRTASEHCTDEQLIDEMIYLQKKWEAIQKNASTSKSGRAVYEEQDILPQVIRDFLFQNFESCVVDSMPLYQRIQQAIGHNKHILPKIERYTKTQHIFDFYNVSTQIEKALRNKVWLNNGSYLIIEQTEAMTVIDVNTGRFTGKQSLEDTVFKVNQEAALEVARQIRLRDIGGIIIIDFIDMHDESLDDQLIETFKKALKADRTQWHVLGMTKLGLVEMTRKRQRPNIIDLVSQQCPYCHGGGRVKSFDSMAAHIEAHLLEYKQQDVEAILLQAHPKVIEQLKGEQNEKLKTLEKECRFRIFFHDKSTEHVHIESFQVLYMGTLDEVQKRLS